MLLACDWHMASMFHAPQSYSYLTISYLRSGAKVPLALLIQYLQVFLIYFCMFSHVFILFSQCSLTSILMQLLHLELLCLYRFIDH